MIRTHDDVSNGHDRTVGRAAARRERAESDVAGGGLACQRDQHRRRRALAEEERRASPLHDDAYAHPVVAGKGRCRRATGSVPELPVAVAVPHGRVLHGVGERRLVRPEVDLLVLLLAGHPEVHVDEGARRHHRHRELDRAIAQLDVRSNGGPGPHPNCRRSAELFDARAVSGQLPAGVEWNRPTLLECECGERGDHVRRRHEPSSRDRVADNSPSRDAIRQGRFDESTAATGQRWSAGD